MEEKWLKKLHTKSKYVHFSEKSAGGISSSRKKAYLCVTNAVVAQLVEHQLPKLRVAGSNPVYRSQSGSFARIF